MIQKLISTRLSISENQILRTLELLESGATIPFVSRYRKETTGGLDEVQIANIKLQNEVLQEVKKRREYVLHSIDEQDKLTPELKLKLENSWDLSEIEDIYMPFKPKRQTRAEIARQKGLESLAKIIISQQSGDVGTKASQYVKGDVKNIIDAIAGACDIIAEWISENIAVRNSIRNLFEREAYIVSKVVKGKEQTGDKYRDYFDFAERLNRCSSHQLLAIRRGEADGYLKVNIQPDDEYAIERIEQRIVRGNTEASDYVQKTVKDAYKRLVKPSIETEFATLSKSKADDEAIKVFAGNLRQLLLAAPLGQKRVLGIDPGYRSGCKLVCLDAEGNLMHNETIYPHAPQKETSKSASKISQLVSTYDIDAIAIGNGTASRETEHFVANVQYDKKVQVFVVSENGASIYSASKVARDEFPEYDVTVRGAVSIGRRLMDPLAELVKLDPKSIGVGQYQHDVDQPKLKKTLDNVVESCVNLVGVNVNTASKHLLTYISGLGPTLAQNIVAYRAENGAFVSRKELLKVPRMGAKAYEQSAGFLRVDNPDNPLDNSAVHPESYYIVENMAYDLSCSLGDLITNKELRNKLEITKYISATIGLPTLKDILEELDKPGRDPRQTVKVFEFDPNIRTINDVRDGMKLPGIVTNVTNFGCFVDIGIKENGLVHISELANSYVSDPSEVVSLHQHVTVYVLSVDMERKRIQLSIKQTD